MNTIAKEYKDLCNQASVLSKQLKTIEDEMAFMRSSLRKMVKVNDKYSTFTELEFNGRKIRVKYNSYGDETVTENGKKIDLSPITRGARQSINDLRLMLATGRI